jgi:hypothetical protein
MYQQQFIGLQVVAWRHRRGIPQRVLAGWRASACAPSGRALACPLSSGMTTPSWRSCERRRSARSWCGCVLMASHHRRRDLRRSRRLAVPAPLRRAAQVVGMVA